MQIKQITDKTQWEKFVLKQLYTLFVQSWQYGEFYKSLGENFWIFGIFDDEKLIGGSLVVSTHAKRGNFLYLPYGPILSADIKESAVLEFFKFLKNFAKQNKYQFIRISPFMDNTAENTALFKKAGCINAPMHILAETTWMLDISKKEKELLMNMDKNHRYLIRRCEKEGVKVKMRNNEEGLEEFNKLHEITAKRHNFHRFSDDYVKREFITFASQKQTAVFHAYLPDGTLDSSAITMFYGNMAAYRHGASILTDKKLPTSYLLQWESIKEAKNRGLKWYNFWGIAPEKASKNHPFYGITHFKKGFGGFKKDIIHCQDIVISPTYWFNWAIESLRRIKRGF